MLARIKLRRDERELLSTLAKMSAAIWFVNAFVEHPLHEFGHYWAASWLGTPAVIDGYRLVWTTSLPVPPFARGVIALSGGLFAGSLLLVLTAFMKTPYRSSLLPLVAGEWSYAVLDGTGAGNQLGLLAFTVVALPVFGTVFVRFLRGPAEECAELPLGMDRSAIAYFARFAHGRREVPES